MKRPFFPPEECIATTAFESTAYPLRELCTRCVPESTANETGVATFVNIEVAETTRRETPTVTVEVGRCAELRPSQRHPVHSPRLGLVAT